MQNVILQKWKISCDKCYMYVFIAKVLEHKTVYTCLTCNCHSIFSMNKLILSMSNIQVSQHAPVSDDTLLDELN